MRVRFRAPASAIDLLTISGVMKVALAGHLASHVTRSLLVAFFTIKHFKQIIKLLFGMTSPCW
jgi:hypothetical protein